MKNIYRLGILALCACALLSCAKELNSQNEETPEAIREEETITRSITVSQDTKSTIDGEGNISWENGDRIFYYDYYYNGETLEKSGKKNVEITSAGQSVKLDLSIRAKGQYLALLMPGKDGRDPDNNAIQSYVPTDFGYTGINPDQDGSFAFANIAVAHSNDAHGVTALTFKNITSILKFRVDATQNVKKVTMTPNTKATGHEITGRITVDLTSNSPSASYRTNYPNKAGREYEAVIDYGDVAMDGTYYIAVMPTTLSDGFTLTFNDGEAQTISDMTYTKQKYTAGTSNEVVFQANKIMNVGNPIENKRITSFTISQIATADDWTTSERKSSFSVDNFISFSAKGNNGYYNGEDWRCYEARDNGEFTVSCPEGRTISAITFTYINVNNGVLIYDGNQYASGSRIIPVSSTNSMSFTVGKTSGTSTGRVGITSVTVETK